MSELCESTAKHPEGYTSVCCKPRGHKDSHGDDMDYWKDGDTNVTVTEYPKVLREKLKL